MRGTPLSDEEKEVRRPRGEHLDIGKAHRLHIERREREWTVWLNTEVGDYDGLCIGLALTRDEAVADAVTVLEAATAALQGPPPTTESER